MTPSRARLLRGLIFSLLAAFSYGVLAILVKLAYRAGMGEMALLQYRYLFAVTFLLVFLLLRDPVLLRVSRLTLLKTAFLGLALHGLSNAFYFKALKYIPASTTSLILYCYPVVVTLISIFFLKMRVNRMILLTLPLILAGCSLVFYDAFLKSLHVTGLFFAIGTSLIFSIYLVMTQVFLRGEKSWSIIFYVTLFTGMSFAFFNNPLDILSLNAKQAVLSLSIGLVPTALAISFQVLAIREIGSATMSIFSTFEPVTTVVMAWLILGEQIVAYQVMGMFLIVAGIILPNLGKMQAER
jgi:drug/metabolite transporter (DMT)-like permease